MGLQFQFGIISDLHIAMPHTIWDSPNRFHLVEISQDALNSALEHFSQLDLDFVLLPGDLTQHGEADNHRWLAERLSQVPCPVYVVPGNHDIVQAEAADGRIGLAEFPKYYEKYGFNQDARPYYKKPLLPGVSLIGLNSIAFDKTGQQLPTGWLDNAQIQWLEETLADLSDDLTLVMIHHNVLEHLPGQAKSPLGQRYMLKNADRLRSLLRGTSAKLILTGHLHVQDVVPRDRGDGLCEITTGSLVSYPHPYRVVSLSQQASGDWKLEIKSYRITATSEWADVQTRSRQWMGDRSYPFMIKLLTHHPFSLPAETAAQIAPDLREFWANITAGDTQFDLSAIPAHLHRYFEPFNVPVVEGKPQTIDNFATLYL
ncbi:MAG: metallophosphoesterase [Cyanobacteria bacterium P01_D01_bin.128]